MHPKCRHASKLVSSPCVHAARLPDAQKERRLVSTKYRSSLETLSSAWYASSKELSASFASASSKRRNM